MARQKIVHMLLQASTFVISTKAEVFSCPAINKSNYGKNKSISTDKSSGRTRGCTEIMNDEREARHFFYSKMRPKNIALAATYNNMFSLDLTEDSIATVTYEECMADAGRNSEISKVRLHLPAGRPESPLRQCTACLSKSAL